MKVLMIILGVLTVLAVPMVILMFYGMSEIRRLAERAMLKKQSVAVDVVSGASLNTKAFSKAVEVALSTHSRQH